MKDTLKHRVLSLTTPIVVVGCVFWVQSAICVAAPKDISFSSPPSRVEVYDYAEISATVAAPDVHNPFEDATLTGSFESADGNGRWKVSGFSDSMDGSVFRIRFMPPHAGQFKYSITYRQRDFQKTSTGVLQAVDAHRKGPLRVDPKYPWHFIWEGTGEHYFFNGTTAYWLMGWKDDRTIQYSIARLHRLKINRMRVTLAGRTDKYYGEPVMIGDNWTFDLSPWPAQDANDFTHPGFDYARFNVAYWQKWDRMLRFAREKSMNISVVFDMADGKIHPAAGSADEHRFIQYAVDRLGAFSNITWDLGDDLDNFRDEKWTHETGTLLEEWDPYHHLATSHPVLDMAHQDRALSWFGFTSYQEWSRNQHALMLASRKLQEKAGRIIPQTNEEYGYEDHYPLWAPAGQDTADILRRTAWDIVMAGGYQTAGESARRGTNVWPDTGGGWMNGRGDDTMTMFLGYGHMVDFMTSFEWWKTNPHDELVDKGNYCLAEPGKVYAVYLPKAGNVTVHLQPGRYQAHWFSALSGETILLPEVNGPVWTSSDAPDRNDWALLLQAK
ncbi:MAG TPA: DUF4038 domain-containing protein [Acidobacteriaceae bacterium]|nr:DUF4038 domain-containing protein [Acidobacteriaceae bacterium]